MGEIKNLLCEGMDLKGWFRVDIFVDYFGNKYSNNKVDIQMLFNRKTIFWNSNDFLNIFVILVSLQVRSYYKCS